MNVDLRVFLSTRSTFENQYQRAPRGTHINWLEAGIEDQHRLVESIEGVSIVRSF